MVEETITDFNTSEGDFRSQQRYREATGWRLVKVEQNGNDFRHTYVRVSQVSPADEARESRLAQERYREATEQSRRREAEREAAARPTRIESRQLTEAEFGALSPEEKANVRVEKSITYQNIYGGALPPRFTVEPALVRISPIDARQERTFDIPRQQTAPATFEEQIRFSGIPKPPIPEGELMKAPKLEGFDKLIAETLHQQKEAELKLVSGQQKDPLDIGKARLQSYGVGAAFGIVSIPSGIVQTVTDPIGTIAEFVPSIERLFSETSLEFGTGALVGQYAVFKGGGKGLGLLKERVFPPRISQSVELGEQIFRKEPNILGEPIHTIDVGKITTEIGGRRFETEVLSRQTLLPITETTSRGRAVTELLTKTDKGISEKIIIGESEIMKDIPETLESSKEFGFLIGKEGIEAAKKTGFFEPEAALGGKFLERRVASLGRFDLDATIGITAMKRGTRISQADVSAGLFRIPKLKEVQFEPKFFSGSSIFYEQRGRSQFIKQLEFGKAALRESLPKSSGKDPLGIIAGGFGSTKQTNKITTPRSVDRLLLGEVTKPRSATKQSTQQHFSFNIAPRTSFSFRRLFDSKTAPRESTRMFETSRLSEKQLTRSLLGTRLQLGQQQLFRERSLLKNALTFRNPFGRGGGFPRLFGLTPSSRRGRNATPKSLFGRVSGNLFLGQPKKYQSSVFARVFGFTGKATENLLTGLEIRPVARRGRRRRR